jgi:hypothetical protein
MIVSGCFTGLAGVGRGTVGAGAFYFDLPEGAGHGPKNCNTV